MMVGPQGRAVGVEHIPELVMSSIKDIEKSAAAPLLRESSLLMHVGGMRLALANVSIPKDSFLHLRSLKLVNNPFFFVNY